jgi:hypothetical protein
MEKKYVVKDFEASKSVFNRLHKALDKKFSIYDSARGNIVAFLSDYVDFDFCVQNMAGDGFVILDYDNIKVAGLDHCFEIILKKGKLTKENLATISF